MADIATPRVSDSNLLKIFIDKTLLQSELLGLTSNAKVGVVVLKTTFYIHLSGSGEDDEYNCYIKEGGVIEHPYINEIRKDNSANCQISSISFSDIGVHQRCTLTYSRSATSLIDKVIVQDQVVSTATLKVLGHITGLLTESPIHDYPVDSEFDINSVHHDVLTRLEGLSANLIEKQNEQINRLESEKKKFIDKQLEEYSEKASILESKYNQRLHKLEETYQERHAELDERQKKIEDADNTTARRMTTTATLEDVKAKAKRFDFSSAVGVRSWMACFFAILLGCIGGVNAYIATDQLYSSTQDYSSLSESIVSALSVGNSEINQEEVKAALSKQVDDSQKLIWFLYVKIFFSSALLVSSIIYLIKWFNSWADRIAQQELDNQLFVRDLNRAHLAIEMSLEWNEKKDGAIPDRLLQSLTDNLFQSADSTPKEILHPAEQLASALVRSADKINVPFAGGNLEVSGKKLGKTKSAVNDG
ncbi:hypothetical protein J0J26_06245 [Vibrio vulnificus]|uniref:hypothetical protein n=1 Tax=Vibrio vulnificus TaxID=672 RepID=UPI0019D457DD|nr:hypothetical protein [Vibrio vulnificus]MBN8087695.1 hypothetical protein [Vibrio vulnificus]MBN8116509.1 hypothetical protein [Vibrio vulnificus]